MKEILFTLLVTLFPGINIGNNTPDSNGTVAHNFVPDNHTGRVCAALMPECMTREQWERWESSEDYQRLRRNTR